MSRNDGAELRLLAEEVFGDAAKAAAWIDRPNGALAGMAPSALLRTTEGRQSVADVPGRLGYGVFS